MGAEEEAFDDPEDPDASDMDEDDEPEEVACPYCGRMMSEEAEVCPRCGSFISAEDAPRRVPAWVIVGAVLCGVVALLWALGR